MSCTNNDEQFSPSVTIMDTATQQVLDCVLLLHGEKPPEISSRTCINYATQHAVQVKVVWASLSEPNTTCVVCGN